MLSPIFHCDFFSLSWQIETSSPSAHPSLSFLCIFFIEACTHGVLLPPPPPSSSFLLLLLLPTPFVCKAAARRKEEEAALEGVLLHMRKGGGKKKKLLLSVQAKGRECGSAFDTEKKGEKTLSSCCPAFPPPPCVIS